MMPTAYVILNPISGGGKAAAALRKLTNSGVLDSYEHEVFTTSQAGDACKMAVVAAEKNVDLVVVIGGDGTVNEVGAELIHSNVKLAILPAGSGNGLARHLGINSVSKGIKNIRNGRSNKIDTALLNQREFMNVAGTGLDAHVSFAFSKSVRRGWMNYLRHMLRLGSNPPIREYGIEYDGKTFKTEACMISIANSSQYGNNAYIAPSANVNDGLLDVCILKPVNLIQALTFLFLLMRGKLSNNKYFQTFQTKQLKISNTDGMVHIDGESWKTKSQLNIEIVPASLNLIY